MYSGWLVTARSSSFRVQGRAVVPSYMLSISPVANSCSRSTWVCNLHLPPVVPPLWVGLDRPTTCHHCCTPCAGLTMLDLWYIDSVRAHGALNFCTSCCSSCASQHHVPEDGGNPVTHFRHSTDRAQCATCPSHSPSNCDTTFASTRHRSC